MDSEERDGAQMTRDEYNGFCASLLSATHVVQWGGADVWKVGGKVFAIAGWNQGETPHVTFKCSDIAYEILKEQPGLRPAPYLASRGMKWIQRQTDESMDADTLKDYIRESHSLVFRKLPKRIRGELGDARPSRMTRSRILQRPPRTRPLP